jgi:ABC-type transport system involved in multi-copper enzyme maturation permease subunit
MTRGSAGGRSLFRVLFAAAGFTAGLVLLITHHAGTLGPLATAVTTTRAWLTPLVWIELVVVLLVVTSTAATTLTREKEALTMELLLSTPLTSRYIVAGMLQGLVRLVIPLIAVPTLTVALFVLLDALRWGDGRAVIAFEALLLVPVLLVAFTALAAMIGLHFSLKSKKSIQAVMVSTVIVLGAAGLLTACGLATRGTNPTVAAVIGPFTPVWSLQALLDPEGAAAKAASNWPGSATITPGEINSFRVLRAVFSLVAAGVYLGVTYALYNSMVRGFDMVVRRQSV